MIVVCVRLSRCVWSDGLEPHRRSTGEVSMCSGRLRAHSIPGTTDSVRQAAAEAAVAAYRLGAGHRTAVFRAARRQDSDRHADT